jgi:hypothetical protein
VDRFLLRRKRDKRQSRSAPVLGRSNVKVQTRPQKWDRDRQIKPCFARGQAHSAVVYPTYPSVYPHHRLYREKGRGRRNTAEAQQTQRSRAATKGENRQNHGGGAKAEHRTSNVQRPTSNLELHHSLRVIWTIAVQSEEAAPSRLRSSSQAANDLDYCRDFTKNLIFNNALGLGWEPSDGLLPNRHDSKAGRFLALRILK